MYLSKLKYPQLSISAAIAAVLLALAPAKALNVTVTPAQPKLGDTLSVVISSDNSDPEPIVIFKNKNYPAFAITGDRYRALLPTSPLDLPGKVTIRIKDAGSTQDLKINLAKQKFPVQRIRLSGKASRSATKLEQNRVAEFKSLVTSEKYWRGNFIRPNAGRISTVFGVRRYYNGVFARDYYHQGVDYAGGYGSPIVAPAAGKVVLVGTEAEGFRVHGNTIGIDHGQGVLSIFLHLSKINIREGDLVKAGQLIGAVGSTGASTGPHLHWGLYVHGVAVDPALWRLSEIN
jgi:murein DD-endopeptidase MepM/ murein hydrolase activator NlpD